MPRLNRHMLDDFRPTFLEPRTAAIWNNITGTCRPMLICSRARRSEDPNLLYAGTELGLFASYNGGKEWIRLNLKNLPHVAIHDIKIHPRENDLILATHGRSLWILDDASPIQQMTSELLTRDAHLFPVRPALRFTSRFTRYGIGDKVFAGPNPSYGALITYHLKEKPDDKATLRLRFLIRREKLAGSKSACERERRDRIAGPALWWRGSTTTPPRKSSHIRFAARSAGSSR